MHSHHSHNSAVTYSCSLLRYVGFSFFMVLVVSIPFWPRIYHLFVKNRINRLTELHESMKKQLEAECHRYHVVLQMCLELHMKKFGPKTESATSHAQRCHRVYYIPGTGSICFNCAKPFGLEVKIKQALREGAYEKIKPLLTKDIRHDQYLYDSTTGELKVGRCCISDHLIEIMGEHHYICLLCDPVNDTDVQSLIDLKKDLYTSICTIKTSLDAVKELQVDAYILNINHINRFSWLSRKIDEYAPRVLHCLNPISD